LNIYYLLSIYLWLYSPLLGLGRFFGFLIFYTVTPWTGYQSVARRLPTDRTAQKQNKRTQTFMPQVGFKPTIPVFDRTKTVYALDRVATVIGNLLSSTITKYIKLGVSSHNLDVTENKDISCHCRDSNIDPRTSKPQLTRYPD
jgi:hypothetical protein